MLGYMMMLFLTVVLDKSDKYIENELKDNQELGHEKDRLDTTATYIGTRG